MKEAVERSLQEALEEEGALVADALLRSKADAPRAFSFDGVMMLRLTRMARSPKVTNALLQAPEPEECRAHRMDLEARHIIAMERKENAIKTALS